MNTMPCSATFYERVTDAGTQAWPPVRVVDSLTSAQRERLVDDERIKIMRVALGLEKDVARDGTVRSLHMDSELAADLIDNTGAIEELVRLVCAKHANACTVTDQQLAQVIEKAVLDAVDKLAEYRAEVA